MKPQFPKRNIKLCAVLAMKHWRDGDFLSKPVFFVLASRSPDAVKANAFLIQRDKGATARAALAPLVFTMFTKRFKIARTIVSPRIVFQAAITATG